MKISILLFTTGVSFLLLSGCASNLPMTSSLNDFVMMGTKVNTTENVSFYYESNISDGQIKPFNKDRVKEASGHPGFNHTESATLNRMLNEFMGNKFTNLSPNGSTKIKVTLKDFWVEQYSTDSGGKQTLTVLFGGETNIMCVAKVKILVSVNRNGNVSTKVITGSSEDSYVSGVGTGTSTSNIYRGKDSIEHTHARNINNANNKVLMLLNAYLDDILSAGSPLANKISGDFNNSSQPYRDNISKPIKSENNIEIVKIAKDLALINKGFSSGIKKGDVFHIYKINTDGSYFEYGTCEVLKILENKSAIKLINCNPGYQLELGDVVKK